MALVIDNVYTKGISGRVGDQLLYKQFGNKTVVAAFLRPSLKPPTPRQLAQRQKFALAVLKTRAWLADKAKRTFLEGLERKWAAYSTYHAGIRYFMNQNLEDGGEKLEARNQSLGAGIQRLEVGSKKLEARNDVALEENPNAKSNPQDLKQAEARGLTAGMALSLQIVQALHKGQSPAEVAHQLNTPLAQVLAMKKAISQ